MRRVVVTGLGIVSSLGNNQTEVLESLKTQKSGIGFNESFKELGFRSHVSGIVDIKLDELIDRKLMRFMGEAAAFSYIAMDEAVKDSGLTPEQISDVNTGIIMGSGGASSENIVESVDILREKGIKRVGPYRVPRIMASSIVASLSTAFKIKGLNYGITSACATSAHSIGAACEQIQMGKQNIMFAGGGDESHWTFAMSFDAMGALSSKYNDNPETASRAYDANRDGFVISSGAGVLVLEELEHALARGAKIYGELEGYAATSDGADMVAPSGEGAERCMQLALKTCAGPVDYINAHGTSTPAGDITELNAMRNVFKDNVPLISSTKSLSGHSLGGAGVHEAIFSLLMMEHNFLTGSANIETLDPGAEEMPILRKNVNHDVKRVMSNSFGFGGTNASLVFAKYPS
ncbi:beta-ketoacyl-ACP synthase I [Oceaniserpentilla sp. 4NH20-0058]|uniref:beta-ketoacyl-ACP synthase I n=1 Tax=Oceaniserpentilla sp. 4NH20-0058 TaxID=3127660 RepID=UPI0031092383